MDITRMNRAHSIPVLCTAPLIVLHLLCLLHLAHTQDGLFLRPSSRAVSFQKGSCDAGLSRPRLAVERDFYFDTLSPPPSAVTPLAFWQ